MDVSSAPALAMNTNRECGCKSFRTCRICELKHGLPRDLTTENRVRALGDFFILDPESEVLFQDKGSELVEVFDKQIWGVKLYPNFISEEEEERLLQDLSALPWAPSVSGRRKQNHGPRANFKGRRVKVGNFCGFPASTSFVQGRFRSVPCLEGYRAVEQCTIEYRPETGACIEPHVDDCWIWGERVVQLNLLSDTVLTLLPYRGGDDRYNLRDVGSFPRVLDERGEKVLFNPFGGGGSGPLPALSRPYVLSENEDGGLRDAAVKVHLPRRSLLVLHGEARYDWEHCILRDDIKDRRFVIAYRELTLPYLSGGRFEELGRQILEKATVFW